MTTILLDPTLRRARIVRVTVAVLTTIAVAGLALGDDGAVIDHLDRGALRVASQLSVRATVLLQNIDARDGWRGDRVRALARDRGARARLAEALTGICRREGLVGVHLDLEDL